jgi:type II secretory pathway component PulM
MQPQRCREATVRLGRRMRDYTTREKLKIAAGAISALVIVAWLAVLTIAFLAA